MAEHQDPECVQRNERSQKRFGLRNYLKSALQLFFISGWLLVPLSCVTGIMVGRGQNDYRHYQRMEEVVKEVIASDIDFSKIRCYESSSCHMSIDGSVSSPEVEAKLKDEVSKKVGSSKMPWITFHLSH